MRYWQQKCSSTLWRVFLEGESLLCSTYPWFIPGCRGSWPLAVSISSVVDHVPFPWAAHCTVRESYLYKVIVMLYWERKKRRVTTLYLADVTGGKQARVVVVWSLQLCSFGFCELEPTDTQTRFNFAFQAIGVCLDFAFTFRGSGSQNDSHWRLPLISLDQSLKPEIS